jgi:hypothetical protein
MKAFLKNLDVMCDISDEMTHQRLVDGYRNVLDHSVHMNPLAQKLPSLLTQCESIVMTLWVF